MLVCMTKVATSGEGGCGEVFQEEEAAPTKAWVPERTYTFRESQVGSRGPAFCRWGDMVRDYVGASGLQSGGRGSLNPASGLRVSASRQWGV